MFDAPLLPQYSTLTLLYILTHQQTRDRENLIWLLQCEPLKSA